MSADADDQFWEDLRRFVRIATALSGGPVSMARIADSLGIAQPTVSDTLRRLEARYDRVLINRTPGSSANALSVDGERLLAESRRLRQPEILCPQPERPALRVVLSRSLLTTDLLFPDLPDFIRETRRTADVDIDFSDSFDFARAVADVERKELGLAVSFKLKAQADRDVPGGRLRVDSGFSPLFDVVVIAGSERDLPDPEPAAVLPLLSSARVVTVNRDLEPLDVRAVVPNEAAGGRRQAVGSVDAVLAHVRCGLADYGVVPAIYQELDKHWQNGVLAYSRRLAQAELVMVSRKDATRPIADFTARLREFIARLKPDGDRLSHYSTLPVVGPNQAGGVFPTEPEWYESLRWGYYVDHDRGEDNWALRGALKWRFEGVWLYRTAETDGAERYHGRPALRFGGTIRNAVGAEFGCAAELRSNVFVVRAGQPGRRTARQSVFEFQSVFSWCDPVEGLVYGTWRDLDPNGRPVTYSTVWSHRPLRLGEIQAVTAYASRTVGLRATEGCDFDRHPPDRPPTPDRWAVGGD